MIRILEGDCREVMATLDAGSVDAIVTDPPYELGFMGKGWDSTGIANDVNVWRAALRVLKPGGHLLAFSGTRTYHRMVCAIEDAGFEIRDQIGWVYGSGFPKSLDVSKAIDKAAGAEREIVGVSPNWRESKRDREKHGSMEVRGENAGLLSGPPVTDAARQWQGWGTALKPAQEPIVWATKPLTAVPVDVNLLREVETLLGCALCLLLLNVRSAEWFSESSPSEYVGASASALTLAALLHGPLSEEWCAAMGMCNSPEAVSTSLSIVSSWRHISNDLLARGNRYTTSTATALTTALRTLRSCLSEIMPGIIIRALTCPLGASSIASAAESHSRDESLRSNCTRSDIATELASLIRRLTTVSNVAANSTAAAAVANSVLLAAITDLGESPLAPSPSLSPIVLARRPLVGTVAANVLRFGTGALNIDASRVPSADGDTVLTFDRHAGERDREQYRTGTVANAQPSALGRWPANIILDGSDEVLAAFPQTTTNPGTLRSDAGRGNIQYAPSRPAGTLLSRGDTGSAARFFYTAKASAHDRNDGLQKVGGSERSHHPTVKPTDLMRYLCRLVTPPGGLILDPFMGSGSTLKAAELEGFSAIGIELDPAYIEIARRRIASDAPLFAEVA